MNVVFIMNEFSLHNNLVASYHAARPNDKVSLIKVPLVLKGKSRTDTALRILPKLSKRFIWDKLQEYIVIAAITCLPKFFKRGPIFLRLRSIASAYQFPFYCTSDIMSEATINFLHDQKPDVIVTLFHQILRKKLIDVPRLGVVNIHPGILPDFRGIQPYFWELMKGFGQAGASLHMISDESVDTGALLACAQYKTWPGMSVQLNYYLTIRAASWVLPKALEALERGSIQPIPQDGSEGEYYRWPDRVSVDELERRGHRILRWSDLKDILIGRYDHFQPEVWSIAQKDKH